MGEILAGFGRVALPGEFKGPGRPGGLLPPGSHRSRRADFPHLAPHVRNSLRDGTPSGLPSCAIRCCFVDTSTGSDAPAMFPSNGVLTRRPLPSTGSLRTGSPASTVLRDAPTPRRPSRRASLPSLGDTTGASPVCSRRSATRDRGLRGVGIPVPEPEFAVETTGSPRFLGNPDGHCPCPSTPVGPIALCGTKCSATDAAPAHVHNEGS